MHNDISEYIRMYILTFDKVFNKKNNNNKSRRNKQTNYFVNNLYIAMETSVTYLCKMHTKMHLYIPNIYMYTQM